MANFFAALSLQSELAELTTVFGNVTAGTATKSARRLCDLAGMKPVAEATGKPPVLLPFTPSFMSTGMRDLVMRPPTARLAPNDLDAADFMIEQARAARGVLAISAIGPITNVAEPLRRGQYLSRPARLDRGVNLLCSRGAGRNDASFVCGRSIQNECSLCCADPFIARKRKNQQRHFTKRIIFSNRVFIDHSWVQIRDRFPAGNQRCGIFLLRESPVSSAA